MTQMLFQEPGWKYERKGSALFLRRDSEQLPVSKTSRVCFRCDVEVREYESDDDYYYDLSTSSSSSQNHHRDSSSFGDSLDLAASPLAMCASFLVALAVTVVLPWLLIGG